MYCRLSRSVARRTLDGMAPVTTAAAPDSLSYGTARDLANMLDGIGVLLCEEPQEKWDTDPDLRESTKALYEHLGFRLHPATRKGLS